MSKMRVNFGTYKSVAAAALSCALAIFATDALSMTVGDMADAITASFAQLTKLITAGSYIAGMGFAVGAIIQFKAHKDNPSQVPVGKPIALVFIAAALIFLPTILDIAGQTMFKGEGKVSGPTGTVFTTGS